MGKNFKDNAPLLNLAGSPEIPAVPPQNVETKKRGRPKTKDVENTCRKINVAIPIDLLDQLNETKGAFGGNVTEYIVRLIKKDLNQNYDNYKAILEMQKDVSS